MYREKTSKLFAKYALPQMVGLLINSVYVIVDGIFIGNRLGRDALAAAAVGVPAVEILIAISLAISTGAAIIISGSLGRGEKKKANEIFNLAVLLAIVVSGIIVLLGNLFLQPLTSLLGATPDIHADAATYLSTILTFCPALILSFLISGLVRCDNRPKLAMAALIIGSVFNIVFDYIFMYPLNMGIFGAALATALGPVLSVLIMLPHFLRKKGFLYFSRFKVALRDIGKIFTLGIPAFIMEFSIGIVTFIYNFAIIQNGYEEMGLAAYLIIGYLALIIITLFLGIGQGLQPLFSYFDGEGNLDRGRDLLRFSSLVVLGVGALAYLAVLFFSKGFITIFAPGDTALISFTHGQALYYFWGFLFAGYNILMISYWQSVRRTKSALFTSLMRSLIALPVLIALLPVFFGGSSIWVCHSLAETATAGMAFLLFFIQNRRERRGALREKQMV